MKEFRPDSSTGIMQLTEEINQIKDIDILLERILHCTRQYTKADAGTIYLAEKGRLRISYIQNDTLFQRDPANPLLFMDQTIDIDPSSMAGYVALSKRPLMIRDAYRMPSTVPYRHNRRFDEQSQYKTHSLLIFPLIGSHQKLVGVMQIINAKNEQTRIVPFLEKDKLYVSFFGNFAAVAIERALMTREIILRMIKMAEFRDPQETGFHVKRVAAYSAAIYQTWASLRGIPGEERKRQADLIKIAAMLHDVGKVAIPDKLLQKKTCLKPLEFERMKWHTLFGARLFHDSTSDWDDMAREVALNHHEKWDGTGYPGKIEDIYSSDCRLSPGKSGNEIPLAARIVALADVFDALSSQRCYKNRWSEEQTLDYILQERGRHFDPEIVDVFMDIYSLILRYQEKYCEVPSA